MTLPGLEDILPLLPGAGALVVLVGFACLLQPKGDSRAPTSRRVVYLALASLGCVLALFVTWTRSHSGLPQFGGSSSERALWALLIAAVVSALVEAPAGSRAARFAACAAQLPVAVGVAYFVLKSLVERPVDAAGALDLGVVAIVGGLLTICSWIVAAGEQREDVRPGVGLLCVSFASGAFGQLALEYGSASIGQLTGTLAIGLGATGAMLLLTRAREVARVAGAAGVLALGTVATVVWFYVDERPPVASFALIGAAASVAHVGALAPVRHRPMVRIFVCAGLAVVLCVLAVWIGVDALPPREDDPYSEFK